MYNRLMDHINDKVSMRKEESKIFENAHSKDVSFDSV